jgi:hypothetical protein
MLRFFFGGGTKKEMFEEYFKELVLHLLDTYKEKKFLVLIMDNLPSHKSSFILEFMELYPKFTILYTPSCTPM